MSVRLLFDENLSPALVGNLADAFPASAHVRDLQLQSSSDEEIWRRAAIDGFTIVTKDDDFRQRLPNGYTARFRRAGGEAS